MATPSGFIDSSGVIFYHPLDDYTEAVQGETWSGLAGFCPGVIVSGMCSPRSGFPNVSSGLSQSDVYDNGAWLAPISGGSSKALFVHWQAAGPDGMYAKVVTVDENNDISVGSDSILSMSTFYLNRGTSQFVNISGNRFAGAFARDNGWYIDVVSLDVSGDTVTWNNKSSITGISSEFYNAGYSMDVAAVPNATSGGFLINYYESIAFPAKSGLYMKYCTIADNGDITLGDKVEVDYGLEGRITVLSPTQGVITYADKADSNQQVMRLININGTTLTFGDKVSVDGGLSAQPNWIWKIDSSGFYTVKTSNIVNELLSVTTHVISGGNIVNVASGLVAAQAASNRTISSAIPSGSREGLLNWFQVSYGVGTAYLTINDDYTFDTGLRLDYGLGAAPSQAQVAVTTLDNNRYLVFNDDKNLLQVVTEPDNNIVSLSGGLYPSVSGASGVTFGSWFRMSNLSGSLLSIEKDCDISMTSGSISFCSGSLYWNDASISNWVNSITDDNNHLIFFDVRYQGSDNWKLYTSLDGSPWVDQGIQNSGSLGSIVTSSAPRISLSNEENNQLLDEVIMWSGVEQFSDIELLRLHAMGSYYGLRMDEYDANLGIPISGFPGVTLFTSGFIPGANDSLTLVMSGAAPPVSPETDLKIVNHLVKTNDHNPQLVSTFDASAVSAYIEVWDVTDGQNSVVSISNSGCYVIGDTNTWGWSTEYLPLASANRKYQYYFRMTSNLGEAQYGDFALTVPERGLWSYPD
jgi:hypothetical protein